MTAPRAALLVVIVSAGAYANALGNGFALDDVGIIAENPAVTSPTLEAVLDGPYWPNPREGAGLYRPVTTAGYAAQWWAFGGEPMGFHAVNVAGHALVGVLLLLLLAEFVPLFAALAGALLFAVHPVHVEAVANVVGQAEIYAAAAVLLACWLYVSGERWSEAWRGARLAAIAALYAVGLGAKEIAVALPALLVALDVARAGPTPLRHKLLRELPLLVTLAFVVAAYLVLRTAVLGTTAGEAPAVGLVGLGTGARVATALTVWPEYLRLLLFPLDLAADYGPAVLLPATGWSVDVVLGVLVLAALLGLAWALRRRARVVSLGITWFVISVLPVSNLLVPAGVILAERTLYLPSVGLSWVAAGLVALWPATATARERRWALGVGVAALGLLAGRTVARNPTWFDTFTVMNTLAVEHPESYLSFRSRAEGLARVGDVDGARVAFETALALAPAHYGVAVAAAGFYGRIGAYARAEELLRQSIEQAPELSEAYLLLADYLILQERPREAHGVSLAGLARARTDERLYARLSETYIAKGDLEAAVRARLAAVGVAPGSARDWSRLAELYQALGRDGDAAAAGARAAAAAEATP